MKNQYVADENDYRKYGLLRCLTNRGEMALTVAWMLTANDLSRDGQKLSYLRYPQTWREYDPELFDVLYGYVADGSQRGVTAIAASGILPNATFAEDIVPRDRELRRAHFQTTLESANGSRLIFFDPDNGLEVESCKAGSKNSEKYLLWSELADAYALGHSVIVYQHFPRQPRATFFSNLSDRIRSHTGATQIFGFNTSNVLFALIPQPDAVAYFANRAVDVQNIWNGVIAITQN